MDEKMKILKMVEDGKITSEEALELLKAVEQGKEETVKVSPIVLDKKEDEDFFLIPKGSGTVKMLYIRIKSSDGDNVKVTIPLQFVRSLVNSNGNIGMNLEKHDVDINAVMDAVDRGEIGRIAEIESEDGDKILIEIA